MTASVSLITFDLDDTLWDVKPALVAADAAQWQYLSERFHRAGGVPAVMWELLEAGRLDGDAASVTGRTIGEGVEGCAASDRDVLSAALSHRAADGGPDAAASDPPLASWARPMIEGSQLPPAPKSLFEQA